MIAGFKGIARRHWAGFKGIARRHWAHFNGITLVVMAVLLPSLALGQTRTEDEAGDVSEVDKDALGPLRERIRPVSGYFFLKKGRFELSPSATVSVKDAFFTKYLVGASLTYHPIESIG